MTAKGLLLFTDTLQTCKLDGLRMTGPHVFTIVRYRFRDCCRITGDPEILANSPLHNRPNLRHCVIEFVIHGIEVGRDPNPTVRPVIYQYLAPRELACHLFPVRNVDNYESAARLRIARRADRKTCFIRKLHEALRRGAKILRGSPRHQSGSRSHGPNARSTAKGIPSVPFKKRNASSA